MKKPQIHTEINIAEIPQQQTDSVWFVKIKWRWLNFGKFIADIIHKLKCPDCVVNKINIIFILWD